MRLNRHAVGVFAASAMLLVGGGAALAASGDGDRRRPCNERLAKIAEKRGVSVEQLKADAKARVLARIDAAEKAGRLSPERAASLRKRVEAANLCVAGKHVRARLAGRGMLRAAADFLGPRPRTAEGTVARQLARRAGREAGQDRRGSEGGHGGTGQGPARESRRRRKGHAGTCSRGGEAARQDRRPARVQGVPEGLSLDAAHRTSVLLDSS